MASLVTPAPDLTDRLAALFQQSVNEQISKLIDSGELVGKATFQEREDARAQVVRRVDLDRTSVVQSMTQMAKLFSELVPSLRTYSAGVDTLQDYDPSSEALDMLLKRVAEGQIMSEGEGKEFLRSLLQTEIPRFVTATSSR